MLSFGVAIALEASHGDGLKLERARRDASFKEVGDTPARPALSLQNGGRSRSRTEGYLSFEASLEATAPSLMTAARFNDSLSKQVIDL